MRKLFSFLAAATLMTGAFVATPANAQQRSGDQENARAQMQAGHNMPIRDIERRILPQMRGDEYIGFEYDATAQAYRLKFIRNGKVIWVDVDAKTARIMRVSR